MRAVAALAVIGYLIAGAALAQDAAPITATPPAPVQLQWDRMPDGGNFARNYPSRAVDAGVPGVAVMCCSVNNRRRLDCTIAFEWPQNYGFGDATLQVSEGFRLSEESYAAVRDQQGGRLRRTVRWVLPDRPQSPEITAAFARISEAAQTMCGLPPDRTLREMAPAQAPE